MKFFKNLKINLNFLNNKTKKFINKKCLIRAIDRNYYFVDVKKIEKDDYTYTINDYIYIYSLDHIFIIGENMNEIVILSKNYFDNLMLLKGITDNNVDEYKNTAFTSILNPNDDPSYFKKNHNNVLKIAFHDITFPISGYVLFNIEHALKVINFIKIHKDKQFIIHCEAGVSRSGAVGEFINTTFKKMKKRDFELRNRFIQPNAYILKVLNEEWKKQIRSQNG